MDKQFDIVIVGGGLVGASLANALRYFKGRVALIDRNNLLQPESFNPPLRAMAVSKGSQKILSAIGVWDTLKPCVSSVERILLSEHNVFGSARIDAYQEGLDSVGYIVTNVDLLRAMYQANDLQSSVELFPLSSVTEATRQDGYVSVRLESDSGKQDIRTKLLVLSDGGTSSLSQMLGFEQRQFDYRQTAMVMFAKANDNQYTTVYERFFDGTILLALPLKDQDLFAIVWLMSNDSFKKIKALEDTRIKMMINEGFGSHLHIESLDEKRFSYPIHLHHVPKPINDRVILLGDAAHKIHPFAAQGFNLSLRDVGFLVQCLEDYQYCEVSELLNKYHLLRRDDVKRVIQFTDIAARLIIKRSSTMAVMRGLGLTVFDALPALRHAVVKRGLGLSGLQSRLACGIPLKR